MTVLLTVCYIGDPVVELHGEPELSNVSPIPLEYDDATFPLGQQPTLKGRTFALPNSGDVQYTSSNLTAMQNDYPQYQMAGAVAGLYARPIRRYV